MDGKIALRKLAEQVERLALTGPLTRRLYDTFAIWIARPYGSASLEEATSPKSEATPSMNQVS